MLTRLLEQGVRCLLIEANPESALNEEAGELSVVCMHACMYQRGGGQAFSHHVVPVKADVHS